MIGTNVIWWFKMRTLKDKERLMLISKVLCEVCGPLTSREILEYIDNFESISFQFLPTVREMSMLLAKNTSFRSIKAKPNNKFEVRK